MSTVLELLSAAQLSFWNNKPTAQLFISGNTQTIANSTATALSWNNPSDDNWGSHSNVTNPSRFTAVVAGLYRFGGAVTYAATASGPGYRLGMWYYNGAEYTFGSRSYNSNPSTTVISSVQMPTLTIRMVVGDYVELWTYQNSTATGGLGTTDGTWLQGEFVHF